MLVAGLGGQAFAQSTPQAQITLDFSSGVYTGQTNCFNCLYTEDGFSLGTPDVFNQHFDTLPNSGVLNFHQAGGNPVDQIVLSQFGGQPFDLVSFDLVGFASFCGSANNFPAITLQASTGDTLVVPAGTSGTVQVNMLNAVDVTFTPDPNAGFIDICIDNLVFDDAPVGGEFLPIDSTALMLAGLQSSAIWMLPVLAGAAGVGAFYIKTRMNKK